MRDPEDFWDELLAQMEARQVVPVVGSELLTVRVDGGGEQPLYRVLAQNLLIKYGVQPADPGVELRPFHELNDAISILVRSGRRIQDLYRPVNDQLRSLLAAHVGSLPQGLLDLASIDAFRLFLSTTPDGLLARAIDQGRYGGQARTETLVFAPKLASAEQLDLPERRTAGQSFVCHLFGKASASPFVFAIHDEDTLEFMHHLQLSATDTMRRQFSELRTQNLLLVGCNFADWLSRLFIRLANVQRLADNRGKHEFLVESNVSASSGLTVFLERFSPDTWVFPGTAAEFAAALAARWRDRQPASAAAASQAAPAAARPALDDTIFLSYSRTTDLANARQLFADLQDIGADVAWFDKTDLHSGDDWEQSIRNAIGRCWLFLPLVSAGTEEREEGFFREEWTQAGERARRILGRKFIIPVVVDDTYDGNASTYRLVPESFPRKHFGHAPQGRMGDELRAELTRLIRERRSPRKA